MRISATIVALNEERNIARALESLRCCEEVLVVDSGSSDRTCEVAVRLGARVIQNAWPGFAQQKNFAADQAQNVWILSLDADEALSEALEGEILTLKQQMPRYHGYAMPRLAQYCGKWILHSGWRPDIKVRLYHRDHARWVGDYVHESVQVSGPVGRLQSDLLHFTCGSLSQHLRTMDRYTTLAGQELAARKRPGAAHLFFAPPWSFVRSYLLQRGFLDGPQGLSIAWMAALYTYLKYAKARTIVE